MDLPFEIDPNEGADPDQPLASSVLVVDDEQVVRDVFSRLLSREQDLAVAVADSAEAGIETLSTRRFDLLITDKNLPGMGGIELIAQARQMRPQIESILITGYASAESVIAAMAAGASDYLVKPFDDLAMVRAKVRAALERRKCRIEGREQAKVMAREAATLLAHGKNVGDPVWEALDAQLRAYEEASREGSAGVVRVIGASETVELLRAEGISAAQAAPVEPLSDADVIVLDTSQEDWRAVAGQLEGGAADVLLLARENADLGDLLEAIALRMELVGFGARARGEKLTLGAKVKAALMRRAIERAQKSLSKALDGFRRALEKNG